VPRSDGGTDEPPNLVPSCKSCNRTSCVARDITTAEVVREVLERAPWSVVE
jgi:hypothetical protein